MSIETDGTIIQNMQVGLCLALHRLSLDVVIRLAGAIYNRIQIALRRDKHQTCKSDAI